MPEFAILRPDTAPYTTLMLQPSGVVVANGTVHTVDRQLMRAKVLAFLELAQQTDSDLAICPEYSCPWDALEMALANRVIPKPGRLWVLGCEGIFPRDFLSKTTACGEATWIHEEEVLNPDAARGYFLDPLCYVFTLDRGGCRGDVMIIVQFKGQDMSDPTGRYEPDGLIRGQIRPVLKNEDPNSIQLVSVICSDVLADLGQEDWFKDYTQSWLVLHPQLCLHPRDDSYMAYRLGHFRRDAENTEFLCANWARGLRIPSRDETSLYGASALYTKAPRHRVPDAMIDHNHLRGMYYGWCWDHRTNVFPLNYDEHVFFFRNSKASLKGVEAAAQANGRTGPEMINCYSWGSETESWVVDDPVDDGFWSMSEELGCTFDRNLLEGLTALDKERFILLTAGEAEKPEHGVWHDVKALKSTVMDQRESLQTITFAHDPTPDADRIRSEVVERFDALVGMMKENSLVFPDCIDDLAGTSDLCYRREQDNYDFNLYSRTSTAGATVAYVGAVGRSRAEAAFDRIQEAVADGQRLVVWHTMGLAVCAITDHKQPFISAGAERRASIAREHGD